jgi:hypothetical protein
MIKNILGKINAVAVFLAWFFLPAAFLLLGYQKYFGNPESSAEPLFYLFGAFFVSVGVHLLLAFFVRCPNCNKCITVQGFKEPHPASSGGWSKVVWHWFSGSVVCIHCGSRVNTHAL